MGHGLGVQRVQDVRRAAVARRPHGAGPRPCTSVHPVPVKCFMQSRPSLNIFLSEWTMGRKDGGFP